MSVAPVVAAPGVSRPESPYVGLVPYDEADAAFFKGRSTETAIVAANLRSSRLTILYGPSGVGKSSLLMAGAVSYLREEAGTAAAAAESPFAVCVFKSWRRRDDPAQGVQEAARAALQELAGPKPLSQPGTTLAETLRRWTEQTGTLLVVLDQFEEYFQYHPNQGSEEQLIGFADELARIVNDSSLAVNVLLSIREDALAKLDVFEGHIPSLFANYFRVDHLDRQAAQEAIEGPIKAWNGLPAEGGEQFEIEPALVEAVLADTADQSLTLIADGDSPAAEAPGDRIQAPFLQLVLERLWRDATEAGEHKLTLARYEAPLGRAATIVRNHLHDALAGLKSAKRRDTAADCFRFLVSPSKTKIAYAASDLAERTQRPEEQIRDVLDELCTPESGRILRAIAPDTDEEGTGHELTSRDGVDSSADPARDDGSTSYELFHDILAEPILAWRRGHEHERARRQALKRYARIGGALVALVVVFAALGLSEKRQRDVANAQRDVANAQRVKANAQQVKANSLRYVAAASRELGFDPAGSLIDADMAWRMEHTLIAQNAVRAALSQDRLQAVIGDPAGVSSAHYSSDGRYVITTGGGAVRLNSAKTGAEIARVPAAGVLAARLSRNGRNGGPLVTLLLPGGVVRVWDPIDRKVIKIEVGKDALDAVLSADGRQLVVFHNNNGHLEAFGIPGKRRLWKTTTIPNAQAITPNADPARPLLAIALFNGSIQVRSMRLGRKLHTLGGGTDGVDDFTFSADGRRLIAGADRTARVWDVATGRELGKAPQRDPADSTVVVALSSNGRLAASATAKTVHVWDTRKRKKLFDLAGHTDWVYSLAFSGDGRLLASAGSDGTVRVWELESGHALLTLRGHKGAVWSAEFAPAGKLGVTRLVSVGVDGTARIWNVWTGATLRGNTDWVLDATFHPAGGLVLTAGQDGQMRRFDLSPQGDRPVKGDGTGELLLRERLDSPAQSVAYSADGKRLVMAERDGTMTVWRASDGVNLNPKARPLARPRGVPPTALVASDISRDGRRVVGALSDGSVVVVKVAKDTRKELQRPDGAAAHDVGATGVAYSPNGKWIATTGSDRVARVWDARTLRLKYELANHVAQVFSPKFSPNSRFLLTVSDDGTARVWDLRTGRQKAVLDAHAEPLRAGSFSPNGRLVATGGAEGITRIWDWGKHLILAEMNMHADFVNSVVFSPDGRFILTASDDHTAKLYRCAMCGEKLPAQLLKDRLATANAAAKLTENP